MLPAYPILEYPVPLSITTVAGSIVEPASLMIACTILFSFNKDMEEDLDEFFI